MKIGIIHPSFKPIGGAEKTTLSLLDGLKKTNHLITLYTLLPPNLEEKGNLSIHKIESKKTGIFSWYNRIKSVEKLFDDSKKEDVIIISSGGFSLRLVPVNRIIVYCHSAFEHDLGFTKKHFSGLKSIYYKKIQNKIKKQFVYLQDEKVELIANSAYTKKTIKNLFGKNSNIVIYPPVEISKFQNKVKKKPKSIITVSRYSPEKKIETAVQIMQDIPNSLFKIIGNAYTKNNYEYYNQIKEKTKNYPHIELLKDIPRNELINHVAESKIYLHTSAETFGISVVEAMAAGCIPIVPNNSANVETVPFQELRYDNNDQAKEKLSNALNGEYDQFLPKIKEHIENFSEKSFQNKMISYIEKIL